MTQATHQKIEDTLGTITLALFVTFLIFLPDLIEPFIS